MYCKFKFLLMNEIFILLNNVVCIVFDLIKCFIISFYSGCLKKKNLKSFFNFSLICMKCLIINI